MLKILDDDSINDKTKENKVGNGEKCFACGGKLTENQSKYPNLMTCGGCVSILYLNKLLKQNVMSDFFINLGLDPKFNLYQICLEYGVKYNTIKTQVSRYRTSLKKITPTPRLYQRNIKIDRNKEILTLDQIEDCLKLMLQIVKDIRSNTDFKKFRAKIKTNEN